MDLVTHCHITLCNIALISIFDFGDVYNHDRGKKGHFQLAFNNAIMLKMDITLTAKQLYAA